MNCTVSELDESPVSLKEVRQALGAVDVLSQAVPLEQRDTETSKAPTRLQERLAKRARMMNP